MHRRSALNRVRLLFFVYGVIWSVTMRTVVGQGGDCSPLVGGDLGDIDSLNQTGLISAALPSQPEVQLLDYHIVCVAQGTERNTWRMVSGVAMYMLAGGMETNNTVQFHFQCENDGSAWNTTVINSTEFVLTSPNATFDTPMRTDCALCVSPEQLPEADNDQHCVCKFTTKPSYSCSKRFVVWPGAAFAWGRLVSCSTSSEISKHVYLVQGPVAVGLLKSWLIVTIMNGTCTPTYTQSIY